MLLDPATHLDLLDAFGKLHPERARVATAFGAWQDLKTERDRLQSSDRDKARRAEFLEFQLAEIRRVAPKPGEDDELTAVRQVLANADRLQRLCADAYSSLYDGDAAALASLAAVWKRVGELAAIDPQFAPYAAARDAIKPQLEDLAYFLRSYSSSIDASPARLQEVEDRLAALERLKKKHGPTLADVLSGAASLEKELDGIQHADTRLAELEGELERARASYRRESGTLSRLRREAAADLTGRLTRSLADLAMTHTRCEVRFGDD